MQANEEGDLSERARRRAAELANDADLRMMPPRDSKQKTSPNVTERVTSTGDNRLPLPGTVLTRLYKGRALEEVADQCHVHWEALLQGRSP